MWLENEDAGYKSGLRVNCQKDDKTFLRANFNFQLVYLMQVILLIVYLFAAPP